MKSARQQYNRYYKLINQISKFDLKKILDYLEKKTPNSSSALEPGQQLKRPFELMGQHYPSKRQCLTNSNQQMASPVFALQSKPFGRPNIAWLNQFRPYESVKPPVTTGSSSMLSLTSGKKVFQAHAIKHNCVVAQSVVCVYSTNLTQKHRNSF